MLGMAMNSTKLFLAGKLFKDNSKVVRQMLIGAGAGIVAGVIVGLFAPIWVAALAAGAVAGFVQPMLFKDLKYA
jgi:membrane associated rhomboid family serine protease